MAALFLKRLTLQTLKTSNGCIGSWLGKYVVRRRTPAQLRLFAPAPGPPHLTHTHAFSTDGDTQDERTPKRMSGTDRSNIGRKIPDRIIHVLDEKGNDLGNMHRAAVIRLMDERDLRLVKRCGDAQPPEYQLLTGAQIHAERLQLRSEARAAPQPGPTLTKELTFSSSIAQHDLDTKSKQIQQWIEKKYKVQITIKKSKNDPEPENKIEGIFNHILQTMPGIATFSSKPQPAKGGKAVMCILRPLSKKEENAYRETQGTQKGDTLNKENGNDRGSDVLH
ncbi:translation initiation factor IF-3, mitochondrial [Manis pentadactyla]|uniref:translation initiation factor IF-3, mitochondrial n=1 Tax=Manis pentadactyla TaxID=143292 RepID=UPI00255C8480|nr:translation initiation factor IF-3, mitochondrial [Manis pentadactyla]XP_036773260.2 translation initiation factor IF-3, mitochondrial [Manis pentadactyla]